MRTTVEIPADVLQQAQEMAADRAMTLGELVSEALVREFRATSSGGKAWSGSFGNVRVMKPRQPQAGGPGTRQLRTQAL